MKSQKAKGPVELRPSAPRGQKFGSGALMLCCLLVTFYFAAQAHAQRDTVKMGEVLEMKIVRPAIDTFVGGEAKRVRESLKAEESIKVEVKTKGASK